MPHRHALFPSGHGSNLIGASALTGVLAVLVYPLIAVALHRSAPLAPAEAETSAADRVAEISAPPEHPA